jgi:hypothetical protein
VGPLGLVIRPRRWSRWAAKPDATPSRPAERRALGRAQSSCRIVEQSNRGLLPMAPRRVGVSAESGLWSVGRRVAVGVQSVDCGWSGGMWLGRGGWLVGRRVVGRAGLRSGAVGWTECGQPGRVSSVGRVAVRRAGPWPSGRCRRAAASTGHNPLVGLFNNPTRGFRLRARRWVGESSSRAGAEQQPEPRPAVSWLASCRLPLGRFAEPADCGRVWFAESAGGDWPDYLNLRIVAGLVCRAAGCRGAGSPSLRSVVWRATLTAWFGEPAGCGWVGVPSLRAAARLVCRAAGSGWLVSGSRLRLGWLLSCGLSGCRFATDWAAAM